MQEVEGSTPFGSTTNKSLVRNPQIAKGYQIDSDVAQLVEQWTVNPWVAGSSPAVGAIFKPACSPGARRAST